MDYLFSISLIILKVQQKYCDQQATKVSSTENAGSLQTKLQNRSPVPNTFISGSKNALCFSRVVADYSAFPITYKMLYFQVLTFFSLGIYARLRRWLCFFYFRQNGSLVSKNKASKKQRWGKLCCSTL